MRSKDLFFVLSLLLLLDGAGASAQMMGGSGMMYEEDSRQRATASEPQRSYQYPQMMQGYGMHPGMMQGYGMGPQMMSGYGMGPGMMGGYGMGPEMMHGYEMNPGMMYGYGGTSYNISEKYRKFLDETKELRKKLHYLKFDYHEMMREPETTLKDLMAKEKEMFELKQNIQKKAVE